jgi:hypothetical protein
MDTHPHLSIEVSLLWFAFRVLVGYIVARDLVTVVPRLIGKVLQTMGSFLLAQMEKACLYCIGHRKEILETVCEEAEDLAEMATELAAMAQAKFPTPLLTPTPVPVGAPPAADETESTEQTSKPTIV